MKKLSTFVFLLLLAFTLQCGSGGGGGSSSTDGQSNRNASASGPTTAVTIVFEEADINAAAAPDPGAGGGGQALFAAADVRELIICRITITGPEMEDIIKDFLIGGREVITETIDVPSGIDRYFLIQFIDNENNMLFQADRHGVKVEGDSIVISMRVEPSGAYLEPPIFSGLESVSNIPGKSVRLNWDPATDNITPQDRIQYLIYLSDSTISGSVDMNSAFGSSYILGNATQIESDPLVTFTFVNNVMTGVSYDFEGLLPGSSGITGQLPTGASNYFIVKAKDEFGRFDDNLTELEVTVFDVNVSRVGSGVVTSDPEGINCGAACSEDYLSGTVLTLAAVPDAGSGFLGWVGDDCEGTGDCIITMDATVSVTAEFCILNTYYADSDGDGFGDSSGTNIRNECTQPAGYVADNTDCNDNDASVNPGAAEIPYDGIDQDCDGTDLTDVDGDGFVSTAVSGGTDCDDGNPAVNPAAAEICGNDLDDNCNGQFNEGFDVDGDQWATCDGDCDDTNPLVNPGAPELCDGLDNNCNESIDEPFNLGQDCAVGLGQCLRTGVTICNATQDGSICNVTPGTPSPESCDGLDNDCDGSVDEPVSVIVGDDDGYGYGIGDNADLPESSTPSCVGPGTCSNNTNQTDCNADVNSCSWVTWVFDNRDGAEFSANDGSEETDREPLSPRNFGFTMTFDPLLNPVNATFTVDVSGIQTDTFGPSSLFLDGVDVSSVLPVEQGIFGSSRVTTSIDPAITSDGSVSVTFQGGSAGVGDAIAFDFFELNLTCTP